MKMMMVEIVFLNQGTNGANWTHSLPDITAHSVTEAHKLFTVVRSHDDVTCNLTAELLDIMLHFM